MGLTRCYETEVFLHLLIEYGCKKLVIKLPSISLSQTGVLCT